jgi:hypothetical protein
MSNIVNKVKDTVEDFGTYGFQFLACLGGVMAGQIIVALVPKFNKPLLDKSVPGLINEGVAIGVLGTYGSNKYWRAAAFGLGTSGVANQVVAFTAGSTSKTMQKIHDAALLPAGPSLGNLADSGSSLLSGYEQSASIQSLLS